MPEETQHVAKPTLSFAKLVATPSDQAWSQAYNAGNLFVCMSLSTDAPTDGTSLQAAGKDIFNLLQSEFFSLEDKSADSIKESIRISSSKLPENVALNITLGNFKDSTLTVFIAGSGKVVMKRHDKVGVLLGKHGVYDGTTTYASGFLENGDTIVLQTGEFAQGISNDIVKGALDLELPNDVVESLSPQVHEQDNGAQSAIVIRFNGPTTQQTKEEQIDDEEVLQAETEEPSVPNETNQDHIIIHKSSLQNDEEYDQADEEETQSSRAHGGLHLSHRRKLFLSIAIILFILLGASVFLTIKKQQDDTRVTTFNQIYPSAQKDYETGQGIQSLNPDGSRQQYLSAQSKLQEGENKIAKGTSEYAQIEELLAKVNTALKGTQPDATNANALKEVTPPENSLIAIAKENTNAKGFGQDTTEVYMLTDQAITGITKSGGSKKVLVENANTWSSAQAIAPFQKNLYVLDQKKGVIKLIPSGDTYTKSQYFTGTAPDLSQATGMAIDSSIWIVTKTGKILKYTKGAQDTFGLSGVNKPLNNPTQILTDGTMESVYVLDNGNKRILKFDKKGTFQKEYTAGIIANAKVFDVDTKNKRFLILSDGKVWELPF